MTDKTITQLYADNPVTTLAVGDLFPLVDVSGAATGAARIDAFDAYVASIAAFISLQNQGNTNTANIALLSTQSTVKSKRGAGTALVNSAGVITNSYAADPAQPWVVGDTFTLLSTYRASNDMTVAPKTVTVTTNSTTALVATTGTFAATDVNRVVTGTGIPAGTTIATYTDSTHVVLSAAATASASGVSVTLNSPNLGVSALTKFAGVNSLNPPNFYLAPQPTGSWYLIDYMTTLVAGVDNLHHVQSHRFTVWSPVTASNSVISSDVYTAPASANDFTTPSVKLTGGQAIISTTTDYGTTQPAIDLRLNMVLANPLHQLQLVDAVLMYTKAP